MPNETASMDAIGKRPSRGDLDLSEQELDLLRRLFGNPLRFPKEYKTWLADYLALNIPDIPVSQLIGFTGFTVQVATRVNTSETTTSATFTDLATTGPQLTGLPDGQYMFAAATSILSSTNQDTFAGVKINSTDPADADCAALIGASGALLTVTFVSATLDAGGNNTAKVVYRTAGGTATFARRQLIGLRFANA